MYIKQYIYFIKMRYKDKIDFGGQIIDFGGQLEGFVQDGLVQPTPITNLLMG